jgi:hypothetical protein
MKVHWQFWSMDFKMRGMLREQSTSKRSGSPPAAPNATESEYWMHLSRFRSMRGLWGVRSVKCCARGFGVRLTGTLGILMRAKLDGSLNSLGETLEELRSNFAFSLAPELVERALREVGEA